MAAHLHINTQQLTYKFNKSETSKPHTCGIYVSLLRKFRKGGVWGMQGYNYFFLFLLQNIDCGYSLEPSQRGGSNLYTQSVLSKKIRKISIFSNENFQFLQL